MLASCKTRLHTAECALLLALCFTLCMALWGQANSAALSDDLIRLHVIADSDDDYEQALKLRVRDAVLACAEPLLAEADSMQDARQILYAHLEDIRQAALDTSEGRAVSVTLDSEFYPTRIYEGFSLPAGRYISLRILLGSARGQNWWCVVFPPLCTAASAELSQETLGETGTRIITQDGASYVLRFRAAELWGQLQDALSGIGG